MTQELLRLEKIVKSFAGVQALKGVDLQVNSGEITCLVGENGCGKSTLIKVISGVYQPDSGSIFIDGKPVSHLRPIDSIRSGIQVIYQDFSLFPNLSVAENLALNDQLSQGKRFVNWGNVRAIAQEALKRTDVKLPLDALVGDLSVADKQLIAISRAILQDARLVVMDEPTTALTGKEVAALFKVVRNLQAKGIAILFVSHKLNEVLEIAEKVVIMRNGEKVLDTPARELDARKISHYMTGREIAESYYDFTAKPNETTLLKVEHLTLPGAFEDISFSLRSGEILGITGLLGSGRTELAKALFGESPAKSGTIHVKGQVVNIRSIQDAIRNRIGYVPEDRLTEGLFLQRSIGSNIVTSTLKQLLSRVGIVENRKVNNEIGQWVENLHIKTRDVSLPVRSLSGGNQQRVVLAKWLSAKPQILILNGPTVGVDVGSKEELHQIIKDLAHKGMGIIVISDDIPELMATCNRILLMRRGRIGEELVTRQTGEGELSAKLRQSAV
ncbi:MAG: sugar ABC transporter ATP-binding protein [Chloroflexota bacterium]|nr:sugar ABC transporter ATP-binding protein [Chloroflexota bacterium]